MARVLYCNRCLVLSDLLCCAGVTGFMMRDRLWCLEAEMIGSYDTLAQQLAKCAKRGWFMGADALWERISSFLLCSR